LLDISKGRKKRRGREWIEGGRMKQKKTIGKFYFEKKQKKMYAGFFV